MRRNPASDGGASANGKHSTGQRELITPWLPSATPPPRAARGTVVPPDFDPSRFPVLAQHWFGLDAFDIGTDTATLDAYLIATLGARDLPPVPLHEVRT